MAQRNALTPSVIGQSGAGDVIDWLVMPHNGGTHESRTGRTLVHEEFVNVRFENK